MKKAGPQQFYSKRERNKKSKIHFFKFTNDDKLYFVNGSDNENSQFYKEKLKPYLQIQSSSSSFPPQTSPPLSNSPSSIQTLSSNGYPHLPIPLINTDFLHSHLNKEKPSTRNIPPSSMPLLSIDQLSQLSFPMHAAQHKEQFLSDDKTTSPEISDCDFPNDSSNEDNPHQESFDFSIFTDDSSIEDNFEFDDEEFKHIF